MTKIEKFWLRTLTKSKTQAAIRQPTRLDLAMDIISSAMGNHEHQTLVHIAIN